ncbi:unnamed protein product [Paramecium sonneborni]|uniref:Protein kinase domain-containing protein n=1 Tax=Paramecium sonneborni TaxID=65129 RepID=A0A8S1R1T8_9CILI|nr:unnamed protein product [Paramecium sonneborni]
MDIKPANILIAKTLMAKITDFGEALDKTKNIEKKKNKEWQITIMLEQFSNKFLALCKLTIIFQRKRIDCKSYIGKCDGQAYIDQKYLQRLLARQFLENQQFIQIWLFLY